MTPPRRRALKRFGRGFLVGFQVLFALAIASLLAVSVPRAPRGFALFSWSFFEHQLFLVALTGLGFAGALATLLRARVRYSLRDAFWGVTFPITLAVAVIGNTSYALYCASFGLLCLGGLLGPRLLRNRWVPAQARVRYFAFASGVLLGALFLVATLAPRATTHPVSRDPVVPNWPRTLQFRAAAATGFGLDSGATLQADGLRVRIEGGGSRAAALVVQAGARTLFIDPAFELTSFSKSGLWTVFDYQREVLPSWEVAGIDARSLALRASTELLSANVLVQIVEGELSVRSVTYLRREVCVHLAHALALGLPPDRDLGGMRIEGRPWQIGVRPRFGRPLSGIAMLGAAPVEFVAYRHGRLELLRASADEKGPFTTLTALDDRDPVLQGRGFRIQIRGFVAQAAREPSPTAGFGVSQAALDASYDQIRVELAATGIGRGFNTVRIAPGSYELTVVVRAEP